MTDEALLRDTFADLLRQFLDENETLQQEILRIIRCDTFFSPGEVPVVQTEVDLGSNKFDILLSTDEQIENESLFDALFLRAFSKEGKKRAVLELKAAKDDPDKLRKQLQTYRKFLRTHYEASRLVLIGPWEITRQRDCYLDMVDGEVLWEQIYEELRSLRLQGLWSLGSSTDLAVKLFARALAHNGLILRKEPL